MKSMAMASRRAVTSLGTLSLVLWGCGSSSTAPGSDGGSTSDATSPLDAGKPSPDAGLAKDSGHDAGHVIGLVDAGSRDTGSRDTGTTTTTTDTGVGTSFDAGLGPADGGALCGNGTIDGTEECDDGNHVDLDGCDSSCHYEMITRMTALQIASTAAPSFCVHPANALGTKAITSTALGQLNPPLATDVSEGQVNVFTQFFKLSDLTGTSGVGLVIGVLAGNPDPAKGAWPSAGNPLDWWFLVNPTTVSDGLPTGLMGNGVITGGKLVAGPSTVTVALMLGGSPADLVMRDAKIAASIDSSPAPDAPAPPPAALAPGLVTFQTLTGNGTGQGLCGDITVQSMAQIPIPKTLTTGTANCSEAYTYCGASMPVSASCNSLLDVIVGGCSLFGGFVPVVAATQPDVPASGASAVVNLTIGANKKVIVPAAQASEAYSAYLQFEANRAHFTGESCTATTQCQSGQTCTAAVCK